MPLRITDN